MLRHSNKKKRWKQNFKSICVKHASQKKNCRHKYVYDNCYISSSYITHIKLYINMKLNILKHLVERLGADNFYPVPHLWADVGRELGRVEHFHPRARGWNPAFVWRHERVGVEKNLWTKQTVGYKIYKIVIVIII